MDSGIVTKIVFGILFVVLILATGIALHKMGKSYNVIVLTMHKLLAVVFIVFLVKNRLSLLGFGEYNFQLMVLYGLGILSVVALLVSGGFHSSYKKTAAMLPVHVISSIVFYIVVIYGSIRNIFF